jgi:hypothetical protein
MIGPVTWHVHYAGVRVGMIVERAGVFLSQRHFRRQACGVNAQIHNRMYDNRHHKRAGNKYQHFRIESVHPVGPRFGGVSRRRRQFQDMCSAAYVLILGIKHEAPEWQAAMEALILVATLGGPTMFARIGVMRALNHRHERRRPS